MSTLADGKQLAPERRLRATVLILFCSAAVLGCIIVLFAWRAFQLRDAVMQQSTLHELQSQLHATADWITVADTAQRDYVLTGEDRYRNAYLRAREEVPHTLERLRRMSTGERVFASHIDDIDKRVGLVVTEWNDTLRLYDEGQRAEALSRVGTGSGGQPLATLRKEIEAAEIAAAERREDSSAHVVANSSAIEQFGVAAVIVLVAAALLVAFQFNTLAATLTRGEHRHRAIIEEQSELITSRKATEEALRASERFLARAGEMAGIGSWEYTTETDRLVWSDHLKRIHEVPDDYVPTLEGALSFFSAAGQEALAGAIREARRTGKQWDLELALQTATGKKLTVRFVGEVHCDELGKPQRFVGWMQDITRQKQLEQELSSSLGFIQAITDNVPVYLSYFDQAQRIRFANQNLCNRVGLSREALVGATFNELGDKARLSAMVDKLPAALAGTPEKFEVQDSPDGVLRYVEAHLVPDVDAHGAVRGVFAVGVDFTHLKSIERALRDLTDVFDSTSDYILQADHQGKMLYLNPSARRAFGIAPDASLTSHSYDEFYTPATNQRWAEEIVPRANREGAWIGEAAVLTASSGPVPVSLMLIAHRDRQNRVARYSAVMRDISTEIAAREALARQTATLNAIVEADPAMVGVCDVESRFRVVNRSFERWLGETRDTVIGRTIAEVVGDREYQRLLPWIERALRGETVSFDSEYPDAVSLRHVAMTLIPLRLDHGGIGGFIGIAHDVTVQREENLRLQLLNERDPLTGLLNRVGFDSYLSRRTSQGEGRSLAVLYIDLDHFKPINDTHGHSVGDEFLQEFALRLLSLVRPTDAVARLGGDEFGIVLANVRTPEHAAQVAAKVVEMAGRPMVVGDITVTVGASVGVALNAERQGGWKELLEHADALAYEAKASGRGRYHLSMQERFAQQGKRQRGSEEKRSNHRTGRYRSLR